MPAPDLRRLLNPASVAVVGATDRPGSYGAHVLTNLSLARFPGTVVGVHPTRREVLGITCVPDLECLDEPVDVVVVATPRASVPAVVEVAGRIGCGGAVVFAAGFAEVGQAAVQQRLVAVAGTHTLPVVGPNSNGLVAVHPRAPLWGDPVVLPEVAGPLALLTQSGNLGVLALAHRAGLGLHTVLSLGNAAVVDPPAALTHLAGSGDVRCVAAYLEDDGDGPRLAAALAACAEADVRVVVLKVGRSAAARAAGAAHTAALAGDHASFRALVEEAGGVLVTQPHALIETARAMAGHRRHPGRVAVVTCSGGDAAMAADLAADLDVPLADFAPATVQALSRVLPHTATIGNPLDHTNLVWADTAALAAITAAVAADPAVGHLVYVQDEPPDLPAADAAEWRTTRSAATAGALASQVPPMLVATTPGQEPAGAISGLVPALTAIAALRRPAPDPARLRSVGSAAEVVASRAVGSAAGSAGWLAEHEAKDVLEAAGVAVPRRFLVDPEHLDLETAVTTTVAVASRLVAPVVVKVSRPGLLHKTEAGALALGVRGDTAVAAAARRLLTGAGREPGSVLLVEEQVPPGVEIFLAARVDGVVPTLTVGLGGIWAEALDDVATLVLPAEPDPVAAALRRLRGRAVLFGARGGPAPDVAALVRVACAVSRLLLTEPLALVELNPVIVGPTSATAVDAVLRRS
jgi:acetyl-CoA synthetase